VVQRGGSGWFRRRARAQGVFALCALWLLAASWQVQAAGTAAGTTISNTATVNYTDSNGNPQTASSNTTTLQVDELLDVTVANNDGGNVQATSPDSEVPTSFTVTNTGNGNEAFSLTADSTLGGDDFDPSLIKIVLDDGDGVYEPGIDVDYVAGGNDPVLAPDTPIVVFVINDIPGGRADGDIGKTELTAAATTGTGAAGTVFAGQGDGGVDAVVGATTAEADDQGGYVISQISASLTKSQSVQDPNGGGSAVPGAIITYTLEFTLSGNGDITDATVTDPIPANTSYVPGSLTLNGGSLSDAADADAGQFTGSQIEVALPSPLSAPSTQTVTFKVEIN